MKFKLINIIFIAIIALAIGLAIGYFLFGNNSSSIAVDEHQHEGTSEMTSASEEIWTCSMHPQVRMNEPGICPICEMDLIPLEANTSNDPLVLQMTEASTKLANIQTTVVGESQSGMDGKSFRLSGKIQADERMSSSLVSHVPGRIEKLYVTFTGEKVNKGQKIADLYSPELITAQRELLEAIKLQDVNSGLMEAARNKLRYWKIGEETIEKGGVIQETFPLYSAESGIVTNRRVAVGDYVRQGEPLFELVNLSKVWVLFDAYEEELASIRLGDRIEFTTPSIPNKTFKSRITFIDPMINPSTRVASLRTEVSNSSGLLKPEMFVIGMLNKKGTSKSQLTVPKSAVLWTGTRSVVYVKLPDTEIPSFQYREVELGEGLGNSYLLSSGIEPGEEIVTYGNFTIDAAAQLNNQASMMNKNVTLKKEDQMGITPDYMAVTPEEFKKQLNNLVNEYILLKDAFVATDAKTASVAAAKVVSQLDNIDMALIKGDAHMYWMEQLSALKAHSVKISELTDVEEQRKQFGFLSDAIINSVDAFGTSGKMLYVQHCPMAFNNQGADWISTEKVIQNPYFGDKMMKCGLVKKTFSSEEGMEHDQ